MGSCWKRFCMEFQRPMFDLDEDDYYSTSSSSSSSIRRGRRRRIDIRESFYIGEGGWIAFIKLIVLAILIAAQVHDIWWFPVVYWWYPAYLTPWGVFFCIWYMTGSFLLTSCGSSSSREEQHELHLETANFLVKFTWMVFSLAAVMECGIVILYWTFVYDPERHSPISLSNLNMHGICMVITLLHGFLVDRVPVRIKHFILTFSVSCVLCVWLVIQNVVLQYNPQQDDDDDALYDALKWREKTTEAVTLAVIVIFAGFPFLTILLWLASLPGRRYLEILEGGGGGGGGDGITTTEEGAVLDHDKSISNSGREEVARC